MNALDQNRRSVTLGFRSRISGVVQIVALMDDMPLVQAPTDLIHRSREFLTVSQTSA